jgi:hypothetical protein
VVAAQHDAVPLPRIPTLDSILNVHAVALGDDFEGYRNHAYRVANLCVSQTSRSTKEVERIAVAAAFHDLGIWTDRTFDYLMPSVSLARAFLATSDRAEWIPEITEIILGHHKVSSYHGRSGWLVEPFRRADWMDVSLGVVSFGLSRRLFEAALLLWPRAGFHKRLVQLALPGPSQEPETMRRVSPIDSAGTELPGGWFMVTRRIDPFQRGRSFISVVRARGTPSTPATRGSPSA